MSQEKENQSTINENDQKNKDRSPEQSKNVQPEDREKKPIDVTVSKQNLSLKKTDRPTKNAAAMVESPQGLSEKFDDGYEIVGNGFSVIKAWRVRTQMELLRLGSGIELSESNEKEMEKARVYLLAMGRELSLACDLISKFEESLKFTIRQIGGIIANNEHLLQFFRKDETCSPEIQKQFAELVLLGLEKGGSVWNAMKECCSEDALIKARDTANFLTADMIREIIKNEVDTSEKDLSERLKKEISETFDAREHAYSDSLEKFKAETEESVSSQQKALEDQKKAFEDSILAINGKLAANNDGQKDAFKSCIDDLRTEFSAKNEEQFKTVTDTFLVAIENLTKEFSAKNEEQSKTVENLASELKKLVESSVETSISGIRSEMTSTLDDREKKIASDLDNVIKSETKVLNQTFLDTLAGSIDKVRKELQDSESDLRLMIRNGNSGISEENVSEIISASLEKNNADYTSYIKKMIEKNAVTQKQAFEAFVLGKVSEMKKMFEEEFKSRTSSIPDFDGDDDPLHEPESSLHFGDQELTNDDRLNQAIQNQTTPKEPELKKRPNPEPVNDPDDAFPDFSGADTQPKEKPSKSEKEPEPEDDPGQIDI